jgi:ABC-2 type transport system permease protein
VETILIAIKGELYKFRKRRRVLSAIVFSMIVILSTELLIYIVKNSMEVAVVISAETFPMLILSICVNFLLPIYVTFLAFDLFTKEYANKTMKINIFRPISRFSIFTSKIITIIIITTIILLLMLVFSIVMSLMINISYISFDSMLNIVFAYFISLIPLISYILLVSLIANVFNNVTLVFIISTVIFLGFNSAELLFPRYSSLFITSFLDWYKLWMVESNIYLNILRKFFVIVGASMMFFSSGFYAFERKTL